ncbi:MAG: transglutaminase family protein [Planctomycetaceae bacterium]
MAIRIALNHQTSYRYDRLVSLSPHIVRLRPAPHCRTPIKSYSLKVVPEKHFLNWQQDPQGNFLARFVFPDPARELKIEVDLVAEMTVINPFDFFLEPSCEQIPFTYEPWLEKELQPFLVLDAAEPELGTYVVGIDRTPTDTITFLVELNQKLWKDVGYVIRHEPGIQSCGETLRLKRGSCRDSAWLLVQILRHLGLASRFVSGYLVQLVPDVKPVSGPAGASADFTDLHAWAEVYLPGAGWIGLDPTSGLLAGEGHIPLACTPDAQAAAPVTGATDPCEVEFDVQMSVTRIEEEPRVTKPYNESQWSAIMSLGETVDARLKAGDVRLTMGGEPTFVAVDDMESEEWTTAALGPVKRQRALALIQRMQKHFAPQGLLHYGQGKWYPGESLPRWALRCFWRKDGQPVWLNHALIADETIDYGFGGDEARQFITELATRLEVGTRWIQPAYEDVVHYVWKEQRLPVNVDPRDPKLKNAEERRRIERVLSQGVGSPVGYVLPIRRQWWQAQNRAKWTSGPWPIRSKHLYLLPGDSPLGLRLPLDSLPVVSPRQSPPLAEYDPTESRSPLPPHRGLRTQPVLHSEKFDLPPEKINEQQLQSSTKQSTKSAAALPKTATKTKPPDEAAADEEFDPNRTPVVRTACCVESREGRLYLFMPPVETLEDYLEIITAIEETAWHLQMPIVIEGYDPPVDSRLNELKVTPDPGVVEVNLHPSANWQELVENTTVLYGLAREERLGTEKFNLDGGHTGTGGGNHIVLGAATPTDSPFLRRPDLLRSFLAYWNNHPSLSYLFSGMFIGPTSQAPRVDEGRRDAIYELQIAFKQIPESGACPPWLVDRVFRHLLVDVTGNTHRAEFCIDKLYSPDTSTGRLGLVELRAMEMPPHSRMSLAQQLLVRALVARMWESPYREPLVNWGTALHDRYLLPHFVWQDFNGVIADLVRAGFEFQPEWFRAHFEFRFPQLGKIEWESMVMEIRQAIEPWYVLGEEPGSSGTVRYVDSSVERLQIKVTGLTDPRHIITCQRRRVPLHPAGTVGEYVGAVRFRAWQPAHCLHPTIPVHSPLVFDILDTWQSRSVGGCTYHVMHPGGRNFAQFPVNAYEAESRRAARFFKMGHTGGAMVVPPEETNAEYPLTLDLRR